MNTNNHHEMTDQELIDLYFANEATDEQIQLLENRLESNDETQKLFVKYSAFMSDLTMSAKSESAARRALAAIEESEEPAKVSKKKTQESLGAYGRLFVAFAASISIALVVGLALGSAFFGRGNNKGDDERNNIGRNDFEGDNSGKPNKDNTKPIAWLVNAHDCQWASGFEPRAEMGTSDKLNILSGVAHLRFSCGADVTLEGPAQLTLLSPTSAQLDRGKVAVKVPKGFSGFEIFSPQGRVLDLGTEFGVAVTDSGKTDVVVFDGEVETFVGDAQSDSLKLQVNESASILKNSIKVNADILDFIRNVADVAGATSIRSTMPEITEIKFDGSAKKGLKDIHGNFVGLDSRLIGTGKKLETHDENLEIDLDSKTLKLTTTQSDLNFQKGLEHGEYLGLRLSDLNFKGDEDFAITAVVPNIPNLEDFGQFGIYVGTKSTCAIRGGIIKWGMRQGGANTIFMVNHLGLEDSDTNKVGLLNQGTDLRLVMSRIGGKYSLRIENLTDGGTTSLTIKHPEYLEDAKDLQVGIFGANPFSSTRKTVHLKKFSVTIWK